MIVHKHFQNYLRTLHESMLWRLIEERRKIACDFGQINEATFIVWQFIVYDGFKKRAKMVVAEYYGNVSLQKEKGKEATKEEGLWRKQGRRVRTPMISQEGSSTSSSVRFFPVFPRVVLSSQVTLFVS